MSHESIHEEIYQGYLITVNSHDENNRVVDINKDGKLIKVWYGVPSFAHAMHLARTHIFGLTHDLNKRSFQ